MLLAVDVGNTQSVIGLFDGADLAGHWRISTNAALTADELRVKVAGLLALDGHSWTEVDHVILASVVPRLTSAWEDVVRVACACELMIVGPGLKTGMPIKYDNPHEVGADRFRRPLRDLELVIGRTKRGGPAPQLGVEILNRLHRGACPLCHASQVDGGATGTATITAAGWRCLTASAAARIVDPVASPSSISRTVRPVSSSARASPRY